MMVRPSRAMEADQHVVDGTPDPLIDAAWESVEDSLRSMRDTCNQRQIPFMVFAMPRRDQISGATQARAYNDRLASIAQKLEIPYVDTLDALQDLYQAEGPRQVNIAWDGHHTALANETIANTILETTLEAVHKSCGRLRPVE